MTPPPHHPPASGFHGLGIHAKILRILDDRKFTIPTPIQHQSIPPAIQGKDLVGIAQTGTGKTFAFGIPMLQRLAEHGGRGLILLPTRELAQQVEEALMTFAPAFGIRMAVLIGGASMQRQIEMIRSDPRIVVATPGRLNDHLQQGTITLREVKILVLDEADRMLDMGFRPQIERILKHVPTERQTMLFSATMPHEIMTLANKHMKLPIRIEVAPTGTTADRVEQELFIVPKDQKLQLLKTLLDQYRGTILVFSRTKHGAKKITRAVQAMGHSAAEIHANRSLNQRRAALEGFKKGTHRILIATDIAARGIDVTGIQVVINFDIPDDAGDYVHRIGRTARAGREGRAITFASPEQKDGIRKIEKLIRSTLKRTPLPPLPPPLPRAPEPERQHQRPSHHGGRSGRPPRRHFR
ncbi:MAG: ATP-dependent RNA helicase RhlE [Candidatus Peregrinibacteria bacterium Greene0416_19]|nr:MAG: ATP-dependent RNA helicase RhlE [Candidatus Peregrinibacteria bacterium Greene0416_19]